MATRPLLLDNEFNSVYDLEGPEQLGLGTDAQNLLRRREAEERSDDYQGFRDFFKKIPEFGGKVLTGFADKNLQGLGFLSDVFGRTEGSETIAGMRDQLYDPNQNAFLVGDQLNTKVGNLDPNKVSLKDQPKPGQYSPIAIEDRSVDDDVFNEEGPLGSMDQELIKKINSRDSFDARRDLIDEEENLKSFPPQIGQIGEAQTDANSMEDIGETPTDPTEDLFTSAMQEFITGARGAGPDSPAKRTLDDYKKEFSEATGIDVTGKVDKSSALMAMGLALMQNKAGKGFNVGKILGEVGKAGEVALPKLEAAKAVARQGALAGGKYALNKQSSDSALRTAAKEKTMNRGKYWVYKKGDPGSEFAEFDKGNFVDLNKYEINSLVTNPEFEKQFEYIEAKDRFDILKARAEASDIELGDEWASAGYKPYSLIGGDPKDVPFELQVSAVLRNPNYKGNKSGPNADLGEDKRTVINRFINLQNSINRDVKKFEQIGKYVKSGISAPEQIASKVTQFFRNMGFTPEGGMPSDIASAQQALNNFSIDNATMILKESGKTLSDADRKLVDRRVGKINFTDADPKLLHNQLADIYDFIVTKSQQNLDLAVKTLDQDFGITISSAKSPPTKAELAQLNAFRKSNGQKPLTMKDFQ